MYIQPLLVFSTLYFKYNKELGFHPRPVVPHTFVLLGGKKSTSFIKRCLKISWMHKSWTEQQSALKPLMKADRQSIGQSGKYMLGSQLWVIVMACRELYCQRRH